MYSTARMDVYVQRPPQGQNSEIWKVDQGRGNLCWPSLFGAAKWTSNDGDTTVEIGTWKSDRGGGNFSSYLW